jgi:hypothetical protein
MKYRHVFFIAILLSTYIVIGFAGFVGGYNTSSSKPFFSDDRSLISIVLESIDSDTRAKRDKEQRDRDQCVDNLKSCRMDYHAANSLVETTDTEWQSALVKWKECEAKLRTQDNLPE